MATRRWFRLRALVALLLFGGNDGGAQLLDAVVFHRHSAPVEITRINAGDNCHSERCDLGAPIAAPPPVTAPGIGYRFEPVYRSAEPVAPADAPRLDLPAVPLGSRAPPLQA
jgi:hypothetical protein